MEKGDRALMEYIVLEELTDDRVAYRYYPEGKKEKIKEYGIVSLMRKKTTQRRNIDKICEEDEFKTYAFHALSRLEEYQGENEFPEKDLIAWY